MQGFIVQSNEIVYRDSVQDFSLWCDKHFLDLNITKTKELVIDLLELKKKLFAQFI